MNGFTTKSGAGLVRFRSENGCRYDGIRRFILLQSSPDELKFSGRTGEFLRIRQLVDSLPELRIDRVNRLALAIDEQNYHVRSELIADVIIRKHLIDFENEPSR